MRVKYRGWDGVTMHENVSVINGKAIRQYHHGTAWTDEAQAGEPLLFTGLTDKNGVEIYEGDIVDVCGHRIAKLAGVGFVYWCEFSAAFRVKSGAARLPHPMDPKILTVIGNTHQNPELLEGE